MVGYPLIVELRLCTIINVRYHAGLGDIVYRVKFSNGVLWDVAHEEVIGDKLTLSLAERASDLNKLLAERNGVEPCENTRPA